MSNHTYLSRRKYRRPPSKVALEDGEIDTANSLALTTDFNTTLPLWHRFVPQLVPLHLEIEKGTPDGLAGAVEGLLQMDEQMKQLYSDRYSVAARPCFLETRRLGFRFGPARRGSTVRRKGRRCWGEFRSSTRQSYKIIQSIYPKFSLHSAWTAIQQAHKTRCRKINSPIASTMC